MKDTPTAAPTPTPKQPHHFARQHMTCRQYGLYSVIRELQSKFGFIYFDGDDLAASFASEPSKAQTPKLRINPKTQQPVKSRRYGAGRKAVYEDASALIASGWFTELCPRTRKKDGTWEARKLYARTHAEWVAEYPNKCFIPQDSQSPRRGEVPVPKEKLTSPQGETDQSPRRDSPVPKEKLTSPQVGDKDKVQDRLGSTPDRVRNRQGSNQSPSTDPSGSRSLFDPPVDPSDNRTEVPETAPALNDEIPEGYRLDEVGDLVAIQ